MRVTLADSFVVTSIRCRICGTVYVDPAPHADWFEFVSAHYYAHLTAGALGAHPAYRRPRYDDATLSLFPANG